MKEVIMEKLVQIEKTEQVTIVLAVESGSRAWGFPSPDSDFDVRFIYLRRPEFYLKLEKTRDVIEWQLDETLDISGWDLQKSLRLLRSSNPTLFEWAGSPIVYKSSREWERMKAVNPVYFSPNAGLHHYLNTAIGNYRGCLKGDRVRLKKYLYVIRPILACKWILERGTPPPVPFSMLVKAELEEELRPALIDLLDKKMNYPERKESPRIEILNRYIVKQLDSLKAAAASVPKESKKGFEELNQLFLSLVNGQNKTPLG